MSRNYRSILRVVLLYLGFSVLWIYTTDALAHFLENTYGVSQDIETYKGFLFILISGLLLYIILFRELRARESDYQEHLAEKERLFQQLKAKNDELLDAYDRTI